MKQDKIVIISLFVCLIFLVGWMPMPPPPTIIHAGGSNNFTDLVFYDTYNNGTENLSGYATLNYNFENTSLNIFSNGTTSENNTLAVNGIVYGENFCVNGTCFTDLNGSDVSNYIPYTGATKDVDLGSNELTTSKLNLGTGEVIEAGSFSENTTLTFKSNLNSGDDAFRMQFVEQTVGGGVYASGGYIQYNSAGNYLEFGGIENNIPYPDIPGFRIARDTAKTTYLGETEFQGAITGSTNFVGTGWDFNDAAVTISGDIYGTPTFLGQTIFQASTLFNHTVAFDSTVSSLYVADYVTPAVVNINGPSNGLDSSTLNLFEGGGTSYGMYMKYDGAGNLGYIGTTNGGTQVDVLKLSRGSTTVSLLGILDVASTITAVGDITTDDNIIGNALRVVDSSSVTTTELNSIGTSYIKTDPGFNRALRIGPFNTVLNDGSYIEFVSSGSAGYGGQIGGIRDGTDGSNALVFLTGKNTQTERMRINNAGNVGIGTTSPDTLLDVSGDISGYADYAVIQDTTDPGAGATTLRVKNTVSDLGMRAYGSSAPGYLASSVGMFANNNMIHVVGAGKKVYFASDNNYVNPEFTVDNEKIGIMNTAPTSTLHVEGTVALSITTKTADYIIANDNTILLDGTSNTVTATLPTAVGITGRIYTIKCIDDTSVVDIATSGTEEIDGSSSNVALTLNDAVRLQSDGANWWII
jgi:hypothetical protein